MYNVINIRSTMPKSTCCACSSGITKRVDCVGNRDSRRDYARPLARVQNVDYQSTGTDEKLWWWSSLPTLKENINYALNLACMFSHCITIWLMYYVPTINVFLWPQQAFRAHYCFVCIYVCLVNTFEWNITVPLKHKKISGKSCCVHSNA